MLPVVGDAFLLHFLSTQNHSMRKFKQKNKNKCGLRNLSGAQNNLHASRCQTIAERAPLGWILHAESPGSWPLLHDGGGGWLAERCTQRTSAPTPFSPPPPPPPVSASSNRAGLPSQNGTRPVLTTTIKARWLAIPPLPRDSLLRFSHRHTGLASNRAFLCTDKKVRQSCLETIQDNPNCDKVDLRETSAFEAA